MWVRGCDRFWCHRKVTALSMSARGVWWTCASYSRFMAGEGLGVDGEITWLGVLQACPSVKPAQLRRDIAELCIIREGETSAMWEVVQPDRWRFHDWSDYNPPIMDRREADKLRKRAARARAVPP